MIIVYIPRSVTYLGKLIEFEMKNKLAIRNLQQIGTTAENNIGPKSSSSNKIEILKRYIHSQLQFELKMYPLGTTWIEPNMDASCTRHVKSWLNMTNQFLHQRSYGTPGGEM